MNFLSRLRHMLLLVVVATSAGCASLPAGHVSDARDPWERYNRAMFDFNEKLDRAVIKPVAEAYRDYVPDVIQLTVRNFFGNLRDIATTVHHLVQGKPGEAGNSAARVLFNSTIGFLGLGDPASDMGFRKTNEDFGQTFGRWGAGPGPYFVIPVLGPSSVRDTFGLAFDFTYNPRNAVIEGAAERNISTGVVAVDARKELLKSEKTMDALAFDKYVSVRNTYLAHRRSEIYDGDPPLVPLNDE